MFRIAVVPCLVFFLSAMSFGDDLSTEADSVTPARIWVAGQDSDNIVQFDLHTGESTVVSRLPNGSHPRALAVNREGHVFAGLLGNQKNVVRLVPSRPQLPDAPLLTVDLTPTIGRFGPGLMAFDRNGILHIAANTERRVLRVNVVTGEMLEPLSTGHEVNILGLAIHENAIFVAEYFQKTVMRIDTAATPVQSAVLIHHEELLNRPHGMTIGHSDNLFVSSLLDDRIVEVNPQSGEVVGVFMDVKTLGAQHVNELIYARELGHYFISSGDTVYEIGSDGALIARFKSPALKGAMSVLVFAAARPTTEIPTTPSRSATPDLKPIEEEPSNELTRLKQEERELGIILRSMLFGTSSAAPQLPAKP